MKTSLRGLAGALAFLCASSTPACEGRRFSWRESTCLRDERAEA